MHMVRTYGRRFLDFVGHLREPRTWFAYREYSLKPDLVAFGKLPFNYQKRLRLSQKPSQKERSQSENRMRTTESRNNETENERQVRIDRNRIRTGIQRWEETSQESEERRRQNAERMSQNRQNEAEMEQEERQRLNTERMQTARRLETEDRSEERRELNSERMRNARIFETEEQSEERRELNRNRMMEHREMETDEQRRIRLNDNRERWQLNQEIERQEQEILRREIDEERRATNRPFLYKKAFVYDDQNMRQAVNFMKLGRRTKVCSFCNALLWTEETESLCCCNGKVRVPLLGEPPQELKKYFDHPDRPNSKHFFKNIRTFNNLFQMTSFRALETNGQPMIYKIRGQRYHSIGSIQPEDNQSAKFLQIYFIDNSVVQAEHRMNVTFGGNGLQQEMVIELQNMLHTHNRYVITLKSNYDRGEIQDNRKVVIHADRVPENRHSRSMNAPTNYPGDIGLLMIGETTHPRDIVIESKGNQLRHVNEFHHSYDALQYPLIHVRGENGYHWHHREVNPTSGLETNRKITVADYYAYLFQERRNDFNLLLKSQELLNMYAVDMYAKVETERLNFYRFNQQQLRVTEYQNLRDSLVQDRDLASIGRLTVLPSNHVGGPRYMNERKQDALTYVRNFGRPDLFITLTTNTKWEEIRNEIPDGQKTFHRHDIVSRVFRLKAKRFLKLLREKEVFGRVKCFVQCFEWQKRGLGHLHLLLYLQERISPNNYDNIISAEIPDKNL